MKPTRPTGQAKIKKPAPPTQARGKLLAGVYAVTGHNQPFQSGTFANPYVAGVTVRVFWHLVEPVQGQLDWSFIDGQVQAAAASGKKVILIVMPGAFTPAWALAGAQTAPFAITYGFRQGQTVTLPLPWDAAYLTRWSQFVALLGARYDANPNVVYAPVCGPTSISAEMSLPDDTASVAQWQALGYTPDLYEAAWNSAFTTYQKAFAHTRLGLTLYPGLPLPDSTYRDRVRQDLSAAAYAGLESQCVLQNSGLSARKSGNSLGYQLVQQYSTLTTVGFMLSTSATQHPDQLGDPDPETALRLTIDYGVSAGADFLQIYEDDILNPALQADLAYAQQQLI